jgi:phosphohistidine phosphatase
MLRLVLLRHSEAHPHAAGGDRERLLTANGRDMAVRMGQYCRAVPLVPDFAFVSPAQRTRETFDFFAREISPSKIESKNISFDPALYNATSTTIKTLVMGAASEKKVILVVGHNPGIAEAAIALSGSGDRAMLTEMRGHFPAPALAVIDFQIETWAEMTSGKGQLQRFVTKTLLVNSSELG